MHRLHQKMKFKSRFAHDDNGDYPMLIMSQLLKYMWAKNYKVRTFESTLQALRLYLSVCIGL